MSFDLWWKVAKSINFYVVKAFFAARQIWLQSFFTPKHEVGWRNPFLWAIWPYAEGPSTIAIASFFSHWEKHYYYCSSAMHFSTLEIWLSLCMYVYYVLVLHTKLQNSDVLKGFFNLFFDEGRKLFTLKPSRFTISISELGSFRRRKEGLEKCIKDAQKSILMTSFASPTWVYFFQSALEEVRHCYCKYLFRIFLFCRYRTRAGWKAHEAYVHTKQLDYHCDEKGCGKAFYSEQCLIIHKRKHSGELPYICSHCGNRYISAHTLAQHEKAKHLETEVSFILNFLF